MPPSRLIARLDIKGSNVVKGIHLEGLRVVGKPAELTRKYYDQGADEIIYMDIVASLYGRNGILAVVEEAARNVFVPLTVGGGIRTLDDIRAALLSGADKVAINTAAIGRPEFLREAAEAFGSQCIVLSVEAKRHHNGWEAYTDNGRERTGRDVLQWVVEAQGLGVGEILLTSVDKEGTGRGFDMNMLHEVRRRVRIPVIASGGAGSVDHVIAVQKEGAADAIALASLLHYGHSTFPALKERLSAHGYEVRQ